MFGCTDASQVLAELEEAKKAYPRVNFSIIFGFFFLLFFYCPTLLFVNGFIVVNEERGLISSCCMPLASINNCATPAQTSMVAPFTGLKSTSPFPVTRKVNDITFISSNGGKVSCTERNINTTQLKWEFNLLGRPMDVCDFNRRDWINGSERRVAPGFVKGGDSVIWSRKFSRSVRWIVRLYNMYWKLYGVLEIDSNSELRILSAKPLPQKRRRRYDEKEGIGFLKPEHGTQQIQVEALSAPKPALFPTPMQMHFLYDPKVADTI
ncbi:hypothetical protein IFM89_003363, partial [Coptis chinensis]